jgi:hypothetical protein
LYVVLVSHLHHLITGTPLVTLSRVARWDCEKMPNVALPIFCQN